MKIKHNSIAWQCPEGGIMKTDQSIKLKRELKALVSKMRTDTDAEIRKLSLKKSQLKLAYNGNIYGINPFIKFGLEGHEYVSERAVNDFIRKAER